MSRTTGNSGQQYRRRLQRRRRAPTVVVLAMRRRAETCPAREKKCDPAVSSIILLLSAVRQAIKVKCHRRLVEQAVVTVSAHNHAIDRQTIFIIVRRMTSQSMLT